jgi:hypothetical protein
MTSGREPPKMGRPRNDRLAVPQDWFLGIPGGYGARANARNRSASGSQSLQLGEKGGHVRGRRARFVNYPS